MSVSARIKELNKRMSQKLTARGVEASETETTTSLINKIDNLPTGQSDIDFNALTDWRYFSYYNNRNTLVEKLKYSDTSNGTNFSSMFSACSALTTIPSIDTSKGVNFANMFNSCSALKTIPPIDTSKGTNFGSMFGYCSALKTIPPIDTSQGANFSNMFSSCSVLTNIPQIDVSNGTNFSHMFNGCSSLTTITMTGTIKANGLDLTPCNKLSKASITSVINALSDTTNALKVQLSKTAVNNAFETSSGVADGSTSEEWTTLIATKANWTIALS